MPPTSSRSLTIYDPEVYGSYFAAHLATSQGNQGTYSFEIAHRLPPLIFLRGELSYSPRSLLCFPLQPLAPLLRLRSSFELLLVPDVEAENSPFSVEVLQKDEKGDSPLLSSLSKECGSDGREDGSGLLVVSVPGPAVEKKW